MAALALVSFLKVVTPITLGQLLKKEGDYSLFLRGINVHGNDFLQSNDGKILSNLVYYHYRDENALQHTRRNGDETVKDIEQNSGNRRYYIEDISSALSNMTVI